MEEVINLGCAYGYVLGRPRSAWHGTFLPMATYDPHLREP
jgi:hypothetical protein